MYVVHDNSVLPKCVGVDKNEQDISTVFLFVFCCSTCS